MAARPPGPSAPQHRHLQRLACVAQHVSPRLASATDPPPVWRGGEPLGGSGALDEALDPSWPFAYHATRFHLQPGETALLVVDMQVRDPARLAPDLPLPPAPCTACCP